MKVIENACNCRFCHGTDCTEIKKELGEKGIDYVETGGRCPSLIILDPDEFAVWYSASGNADTSIPDGSEFIQEFYASVHGCWKIQCRQRIKIFRRKNGSVKTESKD